MNSEIANAIITLVRKYEKIVIMRHVRPDGDALGSSLGLREILRDSFPSKTVLTLSDDASNELSFLGTDDTAADDFYESALGIVLDTADRERLSNHNLDRCEKVIKIDHHIECDKFGDISWIESGRSSTCEMIADLARFFEASGELTVSLKAATLLYTGMSTDSGRFKFSSTSGETLRTAAYLLDKGIDLEKLNSRLEMQEASDLKFKAYVYDHINFTENGVAWMHVDKAMREKFGLSQEQASMTVVYMSGIKGSLIWLAFIDNDDGVSTRVRLRSRFTPINELAVRYGGGGHAMASGATVHSSEEMMTLISEADAQLKEYKANNEGWI